MPRRWVNGLFTLRSRNKTEAKEVDAKSSGKPIKKKAPLNDTWARKLLVKGKSSQVVWQWEHRSGWRDYDPTVSNDIEYAYRAGKAMAQIKAGKMGRFIMELFFHDKIQHDPRTGNQRNVRRHGPESKTEIISRWFNEWVVALETGQPYRMCFEHYKRQRDKYLGDMDNHAFDISVLLKDPEESTISMITQGSTFFCFTMLFVVLNAIWLAYDADNNGAANIWKADPEFIIAENVFCTVFLFDILLRLLSFKRKRNFYRDSWFVFDLVLVTLMVGETWIVSPLLIAFGDGGDLDDKLGGFSGFRAVRVMRLTRLFRLARFPELFMMVKGICRAAVSVSVTMLLLFMLIFVFAVAFRILSSPYPISQNMFFGSFSDCVYTLLLHGTFLDAISDVIKVLKDESTLLTILFLIFTFISSLTLLNMLVGILCEVVAQTSAQEREEAAIDAFKTNLWPILELHDSSGNERLDLQDFELLMTNPDVRICLGELGVDAADVYALKDMLFEQKDLAEISDAEGENPNEEAPQITYAQFMNVALRLRGGNQARVKDIVELREFLKGKLQDLVPTIRKSMPLIDDMDSRVSTPTSKLRKAALGGTPGGSTHLESNSTHLEAPIWKASTSADSVEQQDLRNCIRELQAEVRELRNEVKQKFSEADQLSC